MSTRSLGILDRMQPKPKKAKRTLTTVWARNARDAPVIRPPKESLQAEVTLAIPPPVEQPPIDLTEHEEEERQLIPRKRQREEVPPAGATPSNLTMEPPIAAKSLSMKRPHMGDDFRREFAIADAKTPRGQPFFGRDPEKAERILHKEPGCPPMVVDFLVQSPS